MVEAEEQKVEEADPSGGTGSSTTVDESSGALVNQTDSVSNAGSSSSERENDYKDDISRFQKALSDHSQRISDVMKTLKELQMDSKTIEKDFQSVIKYLNKSTRKKKTTTRPLSGFAVPTKLTDELYAFLNIQPGTMIARKDVTKMMNTYIVENNCRDEHDRRKIIPNEALKKLFRCEDDENITYFNLQTYMKKHYKK